MVTRFAHHTLNLLRSTSNCIFVLAVCKSVESMYSRFGTGILLSYLYAAVQSMYGSGSFVLFLMT